MHYTHIFIIHKSEMVKNDYFVSKTQFSTGHILKSITWILDGTVVFPGVVNE